MTETTAAMADPSVSATNTFLYLLVPAVVLYFIYWKLQRRRFLELAEKIPGPKGYPIIGNGLDFLGNPLRKFHSACFRKEGCGSNGWCF
jgi:cytochrome P450 family 4